MLGHAHGGDDAVDREDDVQQQDLTNSGRKAQGDGRGRFAFFLGPRVDALVDFSGRLPQQEQTTGNQDHVLPGEGMAEHLDDRLGQLHDPGNGAEQTQAHYQRHADTDSTRLGAEFLGQLVGQDGDEDQVIDAEHDLHGHQGGQGYPGGRACSEFQQVFHESILHRGKGWVRFL
ncbi:hypothetical protein D3C72_1454110 [compost metagenome]